MKKIAVILISISMCVLMTSAANCTKAEESTAPGESADKELTLETEKQKASYSIGYNIGSNLKAGLDELELSILMQGIKDGALKDKPQLSFDEMQKASIGFQQKLRTRQMEKRKGLGEKNKVEGEAFLKENATKEGVKVTASGLQYKVLQEGTGATPKATDIVKVHYRGTLIDGTEFDSSYSRGDPATFPLNRVIPGWTEGVQLMKVGAKYKFFTPSELAYKDRAVGAKIGPNSVLIFEVELLGIEPPAEKKEQPKK